jgi:hypothetical protein
MVQADRESNDLVVHFVVLRKAEYWFRTLFLNMKRPWFCLGVTKTSQGFGMTRLQSIPIAIDARRMTGLGGTLVLPALHKTQRRRFVVDHGGVGRISSGPGM